MLGRIHAAGSFRQTLNYCLEDKRLSPDQHVEQQSLDQHVEQLSPDQHVEQISPHQQDKRLSPHQQIEHHPADQQVKQLTQAWDGNVLFKDRAEIIWYNQCFGNKQELTRQFNEVARLEPNMSLPVFHITLSLPPGEQLTKGALVELAANCARSLDFEKNQYVAILHKDTAQQHLHLVANRVGFDRHTVSDSFSHGKIADFCREAERRHGLREELSPRRYLTEEQRQTPRHGVRLDKLRLQIEAALQESPDYPQFERSLRQRGYQVFKSEKGIAFMDEKKVVFKGSEAGHSLRSIEVSLAKSLSLRQQETLRQQRDQHQEEQQRQQRDQHQEEQQRQQQDQHQDEQQRQHRHRDRDYELSL